MSEAHDQLLIEFEQQERWRDLLGEVLAVLNGDGGHYQTEHGAGRAAIEGIRRYYQLLARLDALDARLDAATVLAEAVQWLIDEARGSREWRAIRGMKPATDISRFKACSLSALIVIERELGRALSAWLAGDKEAGNE